MYATIEILWDGKELKSESIHQVSAVLHGMLTLIKRASLVGLSYIDKHHTVSACKMSSDAVKDLGMSVMECQNTACMAFSWECATGVPFGPTNET